MNEEPTRVVDRTGRRVNDGSEPGTLSRRWRDAGEVRCVVHVARAAVLGDLRIGAQRSGQQLGRIAGDGAAADDANRGLAPFDPSFEGCEDVAVRIAGGASAG